MGLDRSSSLYTVLHYGLLIALIFTVVAALETAAADVPLWLGLLIALAIGILYPVVTRAMGVAPEHWE